MRSQRPGLNTLTFDSSIQFGRNGNYLSFEPDGFGHEDSAGHTWNDGYTASLYFQTMAPVENGVLHVSVNPFIAEQLPSQDLCVYLNGLWIGFSRVRLAAVVPCQIGPRYIVPGQNLLVFVMPNAASPKEVGAGSDVRRLGFAFREISLSPSR
jgi:hypothetical protein